VSKFQVAQTYLAEGDMSDYVSAYNDGQLYEQQYEMFDRQWNAAGCFG
jgi:hypothetical protein